MLVVIIVNYSNKKHSAFPYIELDVIMVSSEIINMKKMYLLLASCLIFMEASAQLIGFTNQIHLQQCSSYGNGDIRHSEHRTSPLAPNVCYEPSTSRLLFENPCYECIIELVIPETDIIIFSYSIPNGDYSVTFPNELSGEYELHVHCCNFCFWGVIEL